MSEISYIALKGEAYVNFITEAVRRSDYLTYMVEWPLEEFRFTAREDFIKIGITEEYYEYLYNKKQKEYLESKRIFEENCLPFLTSLEPFHADGQKLSKTKSVYCLKSDPKMIPFLLEPQAFENWLFPKYPEDLCFISNGEYWFLSETHGQTFANLYPDSEEDYRFWRDNGIVFMRDFDKTRDVINRSKV